MRARAFLPVFLFAVCLPVLGCARQSLPTTSATRSEGAKEKKQEDIKGNKAELTGKEKKKDAITVDLSYLEKKWGIKYKSYEIEMPKNSGLRQLNVLRVKILVEFTKDIDNLKEMQAGIGPGAIESPAQYRGELRLPKHLWFYFFDEDNVLVWEVPNVMSEGGITGKKGDSIRLIVLIKEPALKKTRKIEARPGDKEKDKDKAKK